MPTENEQIQFRKQAVKHASSPEQLDQPLKIVPSQTWLILCGIFIFLLAIIFWSIFGRIDTVVTAPSILYPSAGHPVRALAFRSGAVSRILVTPNQIVQPNQPLLEITPATSPNTTMSNAVINTYGLATVVNIGTYTGAWVSPGTPLVMLQPISAHNQHLTGYAFINVADGKKIAAGMDALVALDQANASVYGYLKAKIDWVSLYPTTKVILESLLQSPALAAQLSAQGDPFEIRFHLIADSHTSSGYQWTTKQGFPALIQAGSLGSLRIIVEERAPISFIFPRIHYGHSY